ncbi:MAG TPA: peptidoglycan-binding domain-containing protein [Ktedonobacteraceae bacterium]|nr:peptidoglycan-binding domain-containing protein [Ktedonobacteraceae bacterium]
MEPPQWFTKDIGLGSVGKEVETVQLLLKLPRTGQLDETTVRAIRGWQRLYGLPPTGMVDASTACTLGELHWVPDPDKNGRRYSGSGTDWVRWDGSSASRTFDRLPVGTANAGNG